MTNYSAWKELGSRRSRSDGRLPPSDLPLLEEDRSKAPSRAKRFTPCPTITDYRCINNVLQMVFILLKSVQEGKNGGTGCWIKCESVRGLFLTSIIQSNEQRSENARRAHKNGTIKIYESLDSLLSYDFSHHTVFFSHRRCISSSADSTAGYKQDLFFLYQLVLSKSYKRFPKQVTKAKHASAAVEVVRKWRLRPVVLDDRDGKNVQHESCLT